MGAGARARSRDSCSVFAGHAALRRAAVAHPFHLRGWHPCRHGVDELPPADRSSVGARRRVAHSHSHEGVRRRCIAELANLSAGIIANGDQVEEAYLQVMAHNRSPLPIPPELLMGTASGCAATPGGPLLPLAAGKRGAIFAERIVTP